MIHPTAVISPEAKLGRDPEIGAYTILEGPVELGDGCVIGPHCHLLGHTRLGAGCRVHVGAVIGDRPQDHSFRGDRSYTVIGEHTTIREYATIHRGAIPESTTSIGSHCMLMAFTHVGHNCQLGDAVVLANMTQLAGHVQIESRAFLSGFVLVHQFVRLGAGVMITAAARLGQDVPPYCLVGVEAAVYGPNTIGLRRAGFSPELRRAIRESLKLLYFSGLKRPDALAQIEAKHGKLPEVAHLVAFVRSSKRGIIPGNAKFAAEEGEEG